MNQKVQKVVGLGNVFYKELVLQPRDFVEKKGWPRKMKFGPALPPTYIAYEYVVHIGETNNFLDNLSSKFYRPKIKKKAYFCAAFIWRLQVISRKF